MKPLGLMLALAALLATGCRTAEDRDQDERLIDALNDNVQMAHAMQARTKQDAQVREALKGTRKQLPGRVSHEALDHTADTLAELVEARGVVGHEAPVREVLIELLREINPRWRPVTDAAGNLILTLGRGERTLVFVAHMDEIGLEVDEIGAEGLLRAHKQGGYYDHTFDGCAIELITSRGILPGTCRLADDPDEGYLIDVGAETADQAREWGVAVGDAATRKKELTRLGPHRAAGTSNDDRVGCAALLLALEQLDTEALDRTVVFAWVTAEEIGLVGADHMAREMDRDVEVAFPVDTFVTSDNPRDDPYYAYAPLGNGPVLRALDSRSQTPRAVLDRVRSIASRHRVPLQTGTMGGGNDGSRFVPEGAIDCPLAWPQRNSHSRVETMDLRDVHDLGRLVAAVAAEY